MEEPRNRYILLQDRVGEIVERSMLGLATKLIPTLLLKGELLEALPENEQPVDSTKIALCGIDRKLRVECRMEDVMKLTVEEADLLLAISSVTLRYQICFDKKRLDFGKRLEYGSHVLVSINGVSKKLPGVVRFKGELLNSTGTMFGIELHQNPGFGTSDGTFRNKWYFTCAPDSGVFVGLDKLAPLEDDNSELRTPSKSPKRDDHGQVNFKSRLDSVIPSFFKGKSDSKFPQPRNFDTLKIDQRVVTFCDEGLPLRGRVRYTGDIEDSSGHVQILVGLELDEKSGSGTGKWKGNQLFVTKKDHACFVDIETIMLEEDFDKDTEKAKKKATSQKQDKQLRDLKMQGRRLDKEIPTRSLSYNVQHEASGREFKGSIRRSNSFNSSVILAAGESSTTNSREFIKQQQQLLDDLKKNVVMDDDERTDNASSNLNFDYKHWEDTPPHNQSMTTQPLPGFSEAAYSDYVNVGKDGTEEAWRDYNNRGEFDEQFKENVSSTPSSSLDSASIVATRESKTSSNPFISAASSDIHELKDENKRLKHEKTKLEKEISEKMQLEKERDDLLAQQKNHEKELREIQQEKDEIVKQKNNLQTDFRAKESQVYELETSLTTAQQTFEDMQQLKDENNRLKLEKCQWEKEKSDFLAQKENFEKELHNVQEEKDELGVQNNSLQTDLRAKESQVHELETSLTTAQQALEDIQQLKNENNRLKLEKCQWEKEKNDVQEEKDELVVQNDGLQTDLRAKEAEVHELETTLATAQRALEECQQIKETCDWVVSRDEVEITDKCLGMGGWGKVVLGTFRGCKVAVKEIHELILSPYSRRLFEREMNVASKCRHPCLLQFIGATNDDGIPLFITELLETSLRALLGQRQLADTEISIISLDVSLALNYLHNMKPSPILHRDVSSANVLLWRQGDQWRGKVSDYGTAKFVQQTMTRAPGAVIYSAPEAVSSNQTPKVDVYSFGVLLCEMCIREMPDPERRNQQVLLVKSRVLRNLVQKCLQANPVERPEMSQIIQEIQRF